VIRDEIIAAGSLSRDFKAVRDGDLLSSRSTHDLYAFGDK
jgi:hypothetical protein